MTFWRIAEAVLFCGAFIGGIAIQQWRNHGSRPVNTFELSGWEIVKSAKSLDEKPCQVTSQQLPPAPGQTRQVVEMKSLKQTTDSPWRTKCGYQELSAVF